jgi:protein dithiol oxidoreductase (disulfide-forming)
MRVPNITRGLAMLAAIFLMGTALAADPADEGTEFKRLPKPLPVETGKQIEVAEFFWYRCPHCNQLEPALSAWAKKLPSDVKFRAVPAVFNDNWMPGAKIFYTLSDMGALDKLHDKVFEAYHKEGQNLNDEAQLMAWVRKQGLNEARFQSIYRSFSVQTKAMKGAQSARAAGLEGVPALLVDGKYLTSVSMTITEERLFEVLDQLVDRARKERGGKSNKAKSVRKPEPVAAVK